jgi:signal transduction histidine kinase
VGRSSPWPWVLAAVAVGFGVFASVLNVLAGSHGEPGWQWALAVVVTLASCGVGLLVAVRRPGHPIGWLLIANAFLLASFGVAEAYAAYALQEQPGALPAPEWAVLWDQSAWPLLFAVLIAIAFVFPDGRLPSPRWRRVAGVTAGALAAFLVLSFFDSEPFEPPYEDVDRPLPGLPGAVGVLWPLAFLGMLAGLVAGVQAVRVRFQHATGIERLQLRWLAYTAVLVPATLLVCLAGALATGSGDDGDVFSALFFFMLGAIPTSVGVAVLRYHLYDIDRVINRTLVYGALTLLLAGTYAATTLLLGTALGSGSAWPTAVATLLVAVSFRPLRARLQDAVDRRFSRARYDARRRIVGFLEDLRAGRAVPEEVEPVLREVLSDHALELRFFLPESELYVDAHGRPAHDQREDGRVRTPVTRAGLPLGLVLHSPVDEGRPGLLEEVVEAAGLAIEIARLRVELRRQLDEVEASRARIVSAGYEERRRLERDLHDGAQQRLISIGLALRHAQHQLGVSPEKAGESIDGAVREIDVAAGELQELARGVRPAQLDAGLTPALRELAARAPLPVEVNANGERFPQELEAAAYFIASEGLTNAVKHSGARQVRLSAERVNGKLAISISDDGIGGAAPNGGSGLRGLADRAAAHGGSLAIDSEQHRGTVLTVELPCE